jgi:hypothetical protein
VAIDKTVEPVRFGGDVFEVEQKPVGLEQPAGRRQG